MCWRNGEGNNRFYHKDLAKDVAIWFGWLVITQGCHPLSFVCDTHICQRRKKTNQWKSSQHGCCQDFGHVADKIGCQAYWQKFDGSWKCQNMRDNCINQCSLNESVHAHYRYWISVMRVTILTLRTLTVTCNYAMDIFYHIAARPTKYADMNFLHT